MPINATNYIWMDGALKPWREASVHVMTHALHYGTSFFEGVRVYETKTGPAQLLFDAPVSALHGERRIAHPAAPPASHRRSR